MPSWSFLPPAPCDPAATVGVLRAKAYGCCCRAQVEPWSKTGGLGVRRTPRVALSPAPESAPCVGAASAASRRLDWRCGHAPALLQRPDGAGRVGGLAFLFSSEVNLHSAAA